MDDFHLDDDDGLFSDPRNKEFFDGATGVPPSAPEPNPSAPPPPAPPPAPMPVKVLPAMELLIKDEMLFIEPYIASTQPIWRTRQFSLIQRSAEGIIEKQAQQKFLTHGSDGKIITQEKFRKCPVTNTVYQGPGIVCKVCKREVYPPAMVPTRLDPEQKACVRCVHRFGL